MEQSTDDQEGRACAFITVFRMHALLVLSGSLSRFSCLGLQSKARFRIMPADFV